MRRSLAAPLTSACRWLFLGTLVYAPWAYGCTEPEAVRGLDALLGGALTLWAASLLAEGKRPRAPLALWPAAGWLLIQGWGMALNARSLYDPFFNVFVPLPGSRAGWAGSVEQALSVEWMIRATELLGGVAFVADLAQDPFWLLRLWQAIGLAGGSIALFGLIEKLARAPMIFWGPSADTATFFATYYYHANAGAFLNLTLLPIIGLTLRAVAAPDRPGQRALWISVLFITLAAVAANASRAAQFIALALCAATILWPARRVLLAGWRAERRAAAICATVVALAAALVIYGAGVDKTLSRWGDTHSRLVNNWTPRRLAMSAGLEVAADAGGFGFGPGAFRVVFPYYTNGSGGGIRGVWIYQHNDYLQTVIEWGWIGATGWAVVFFGGVAVAIFRYRRMAARWSRRRTLLAVSILALVGVGLHSLVDFPLQIASLQLYGATYLGVCWGSGAWREDAPFHAKIHRDAQRL